MNLFTKNYMDKFYKLFLLLLVALGMCPLAGCTQDEPEARESSQCEAESI